MLKKLGIGIVAAALIVSLAACKEKDSTQPGATDSTAASSPAMNAIDATSSSAAATPADNSAAPASTDASSAANTSSTGN